MSHTNDSIKDSIPALASKIFQNLHATFDALMYSRCSSLPEEWTRLVSIMASSRFLKQSLIEEAKEDLKQTRFRSKQVSAWLSKGIEAVPTKLKSISELNILLAHQPWKVTPSCFAELAENGWNSFSELLHASLVLCFFHSLCSIVVAKDISLDNLVESSSTHKFKEVAFDVEPNDFESSGSECHRGRKWSEAACVDPVSQKTLLQYFRRMRSKSVASLCEDFDETCGEIDSRTKETILEAKKFVTDNLETQYCDFKPRKLEKSRETVDRGRIGCMFGVSKYETSESGVPKVHTPYNSFDHFNWETDGYALVSSLLQSASSADSTKSVASCIDDLIQSAMDITVFGQEFKDHIWHYVHVLFGIQFQDFDHEKVNKVLAVDLKLFIKAAACYPERVTHTLINESLKCYTGHERFAINLLVCVARLHVSLLYNLDAFYEHKCHTNEAED